MLGSPQLPSGILSVSIICKRPGWDVGAWKGSNAAELPLSIGSDRMGAGGSTWRYTCAGPISQTNAKSVNVSTFARQQVVEHERVKDAA